MQALSLFPYTTPQHDVQKLMRASLVTSCLKGAMHVFQFQDGERGGAMRHRVQLWAQERWGWEQWIRCGHLRRALVCLLRVGPVECVWRGMVRDMYSATADAIVGRHWAMVEFLLRDAELSPLRSLWLDASVCFDPASVPEHPLIGLLLTASVAAEWAWGVRFVERTVAELTDPVLVRARKRGAYGAPLVHAAAEASASPNCLAWVEHFFWAANESHPLSLRENLKAVGIPGHTTATVAEWLSAKLRSDAFRLCNDALLDCIDSGDKHGLLEWSFANARMPYPRECNVGSLVQHAAGAEPSHLLSWLTSNGYGDVRCTELALFSAAANDRVDAFHFLEVRSLSMDLRSQLLTHAAAYDSLAVVEHLVDECDTHWAASTTQAAGVGGALSVMEWAHGRGYPLPTDMAHVLRSGRLDVMRFVFSHVPGIDGTHEVLEQVPNYGLASVELIQRYLGRDIPLSWATAVHLCVIGHLNVLEYFAARDTSATWQLDYCFAAACRGGCLDVCEFLRDRHPVQFQAANTHRLARIASEAGHAHVLQWLTANYAPARIARSLAMTNAQPAAQGGHLTVVERLVANLPRDGHPAPFLFVCALLCRSLQVMQFLVLGGHCTVDSGLLCSAGHGWRQLFNNDYSLT